MGQSVHNVNTWVNAFWVRFRETPAPRPPIKCSSSAVPHDPAAYKYAYNRPRRYLYGNSSPAEPPVSNAPIVNPLVKVHSAATAWAHARMSTCAAHCEGRKPQRFGNGHAQELN
ncbi:unnamed protein product, partial [Iphiclides podalirius]